MDSVRNSRASGPKDSSKTSAISNGMDEKLLKPYDPKNTEERIYKLWEESGFFAPEAHPPWVDNPSTNPNFREPFTIVLPPPNATGVLHLGHTLEVSMQDTMIRYNRMQGKKTLWLPGTDHAAIATDSKVTKILEKEGLRKKDIGREKFLKRVEEFVEESRKIIASQLRKIGASLDWSREAFTLDDKRNLAVRTAFKQMYDDGLIYRSHRIVNWDPKGQTVISDDEIVYEERKTKFYTFKYGPFEIGTARPETKFGDKYVVMHPNDKRYKKWKHGDKMTVEWINGLIQATVVKDEMIDMEFGTGVMTITPWHSHEDFVLAEKYKLEKEQIIDRYGKLLPIAGEFAGMKIADAREKVIEKLKTKGLLVSIDENYVNRIATAERTGGIIEPQIMLQWFVDVNKKIKSRGDKSLKELMLKPVREGKIKILPEHFEKVYFNWLENLRDWCISRQIWYGHRIPVWYLNNEVYCGIDAPKESGWVQDEDTLDTWFSSGLWTFSTLGWPEKTEDLKNFHPTSVINPGYEILFFWVARMILMSQYLIGEIPFKTVYLHGILRDAKGQKFSKSLGNGVDPIEVIETYGADALRMAMIVGIGPGADSKFDIQKVKAYGKFSNKIWNATRFVLDNVQNFDLLSPVVYDEEDKKSDEELKALIKEITKEMDEYKFYIVAEKLYHYFWHTFADVIIERSKKKILENRNADSAKRLFYTQLTILLTALHPFMPFITEEIWSMLPESKGLLMVKKWPS
ncbi:TPA: valine--tRNA ligase [Candidatus Nomurabacteria bacterium]|uniref:Valine--tRNA ligase n=2 Tax=Candidatus Nomuraibacteriota TaxID=1752729 RepID=A0A1F6YLH3_9BACT|nr:MAG: valyl-tRNA synthetase [Parcubacteria group bacterium GW2011_GWC1_42_21]KKS57644.1 MAG: valyl-tRNA synthetase [Candidatus Nomurabacteria bacterium GW2011_GWF1_42_40]KKT06145.1 MAG: valyl-tRNA synthetase [Candidatus Nomurabacteria bacterium GW2011_GWB1_43_19]KKT17293.1 MAG: valyl-tRNA synthetase [Candidatus Nomurabacteria bacterium GW2011_GWA2_43_66]OGJ04937.1 MAG: valine--tRNA ligase [Candidatus Nomurabacteria bacterium RIFOXYB1_FULL_43_14]OGJ07170.1 MAG: valine--tRNA ligase [Candidatus